MNRFTMSPHAQGTPEWLADRIGMATSTCADAILMKPSTVTYRNLLWRMVAERLTGESQEDEPRGGLMVAAMAWGKAQEDAARITYEMQTGQVVQEAGFLAHLDIHAGTSLDGYVGDFEGLIELKAPYRTARHIATLRGGIPSEYLPQLAHHLCMVPSAGWIDYASYDPRLPEPQRLVVHRLTRAAAKVEEYQAALTAFLARVEDELQALGTTSDIGAVLTASLEA